MVIPGLTDAHIHLQHYALGLQKVECETATLAECLQHVADRAHTTRLVSGSWGTAGTIIIGRMYLPSSFPPSQREEGGNQGRARTRVWLCGGSGCDYLRPAGVSHRQVTARGVGYTAALQLAVTASTPDPEGGRIGRDARGYPNGILFESAMDLIAQVIPEPTLDQLVQAMAAAQPVLWRMGLTGAHDFDGPRSFSALQILHQRRDLHLRVVNRSLPLVRQAVELGLRTGFGDDIPANRIGQRFCRWCAWPTNRGDDPAVRREIC